MQAFVQMRVLIDENKDLKKKQKYDLKRIII